jgi:circadian clock protein KaiB
MSAPSAQANQSDGEITLFRLYIADQTRASVRAISNLENIRQKYLHDRCTIEVVDILQEPLRTVSEGVLVIPTLIRLSPLPVRKIVGDLSETTIVLRALGLERGAR